MRLLNTRYCLHNQTELKSHYSFPNPKSLLQTKSRDKLMDYITENLPNITS